MADLVLLDIPTPWGSWRRACKARISPECKITFISKTPWKSCGPCAEAQRHLDKLVSKIRGVVKVTLEPADAEGRGFTPELRVVLHLVAGLSQEDLSVLVTKLNEVLTGSTTLQMAADSIELKLALAF